MIRNGCKLEDWELHRLFLCSFLCSLRGLGTTQIDSV